MRNSAAAPSATDFLTGGRSRLAFRRAAGRCDRHGAGGRLVCDAAYGGNALWEDSRGWRLGARAATTSRFGTHSAVVEESDANAYAVSVSDGAGTPAPEFFMRVLARGEAIAARGVRRTDRSGCSLFEENATLHLFRDGRHAVLQLASHR